jgi:hypothetical protein
MDWYDVVMWLVGGITIFCFLGAALITIFGLAS